MRLWTLAPKYLDAKGLVALWREALLAKKVLRGETKGYRQHPQLERFKNSREAVLMIDAYLGFIYTEACARNYNFNQNKFCIVAEFEPVWVTEGQIAYELEHLRKKLALRSPGDLKRLPDNIEEVQLVPVFKIKAGGVESWEIQK